MTPSFFNKVQKFIQTRFSKSNLLFYWWRWRFGSVIRYKPRQFTFQGYSIKAVDVPSFIWQFKEIFCDQSYAFPILAQSLPVIYDCGANIGTSVLYFKKYMPKARIIAFEADPAIASVLEQNLACNHISDVEIVKAAVWVNDYGLEFSAEGADGGSIFGEGKKLTVSSIRLHDYLLKEPEIDLLKIDIEGAEIEVLKDCESQLYKVKNLFVEYHSFSKQQQHLSELLAVLERVGFRYHIHSLSDRRKPFHNKNLHHEMDMQLNIFAYRAA